MDVCVSVPEGMQEDSPQIKELLRDKRFTALWLGGAGDYACMRVQGPYSLLHPAYSSFFGDWLPKSSRELQGSPSIEIYRNCPEFTPPEELLTEIYFALQAKK